MDTPRPIGFWLKLVDRLIDEQFASTLEEHGVTRRQWQLLNVLTQGPATVEQLDAAVAPFLSGAQGYALTDRGRGAFERLELVVAAQRTQVAEGITADQYGQAVAVLERMARNLGYAG